jgi:hypothetical protein
LEQTFAISVTDVEEIPGTISLSSATVAENNLAGASIGAFTLIDNTAVQPITYSLIAGEGSGDNSSFEVSSNGSLTINGVANFEQKDSYQIRVQAADSSSTPKLTSTAVTITVTNVNEPPSFVKGADQVVPVSSTSQQTVSSWATGIVDGDSTVIQALTFSVSVSGASIFSQPPAIAPDGTLTYTPNGMTGMATVSVTLTDDNSINGQAAITTDPQSFTITASAPAAIALSRNDISISNGDTSPSTDDGTDFGGVLVAAGTVHRSFLIENIGDMALTLGEVSIQGTHQGDFTATGLPGSLDGGSSTTLTVTFDPSVAGVRTAIVSIANGDPTKNPFTFTIQGTGTEPGLEVRGNGVIIASGDTTPRTEDDTDFGRVSVLNSQIVKTFTIKNTGSAPLNLTGTPLVALGGAAAGDFSVTVAPDSTLQPDETTTFSIAFNPALPGQRIATVTIGRASAPFTFDVGGFAALPTLLTQAITFAPPATVYVGPNPLSVPLAATASSGLPVTLSLVSATAGVTLNGNVLTIAPVTSPITIRIQATQAGHGNYAAARSVLRVITARPVPASLTLINLNQTYDGTPKPIAVIGAQGATIKYVVNRTETDDAPTAAGTYTVVARAGSVVRTGRLVIAKATLTVTPDDKRKFAGQSNPLLTATITGFQGTDTNIPSVVTRQPALRTTASTSSAGGTFPITASGATAPNYNFVYRQGTMVVESFAGNYESLLVTGNPELPVAKLTVTVAKSSKTFTARLFTEKEIASLTFSGPLQTEAAAETASGEDDVTTRAGVRYKVSFTLPLEGNSTMAAEFYTPAANTTATPLGAAVNGKRLPALAKVRFAGAHTAILQPALPAGSTVPAGSGWATASVSSSGSLALSGRLGDGTPFTAALSPDAEQDPGYRLFVQPYTRPARTGTYVAGAFQLKPHPDLASRPDLAGRRYLDAAGLTWMKSAQPLDSSYRLAFGPVTTSLSIDPWLPPTRTITLANRLRLSNAPSPFVVSYSATGSDSQLNLPTSLSLSSRNAVSVVPAAPNTTKWKASFFPTSGLFTGSFELVDNGVKRPVSFSGVLHQPPSTSADAVIGEGLYVLPPLPSAPINERVGRAGQVLFQTPPAP